MSGGRHRRRGRSWAAVSAVLLAAAGTVVLVVGVLGQQEPPQPPASAAVPRASAAAPAPPTPSPTGAASTGTAPTGAVPVADAPAPAAVHGPVLPASEPTRIDVPAIGVGSELVQLGLNPDGTVEVPPLSKDSRAGWYRGSVTPGELGSAVILGHVDSAEYGPAVFFRLGDLRPGDQVAVTRADGTVAVFTVDRVVSYPKDSFPTVEVYGNTNRAELRLITCGGAYDPAARSYLDNIVVYASLTGSHPA